MCFCLVSLFFSHAGASYAEKSEQLNTEQLNKVKAAYIYNFTKYIELPNNRFENDSSDFNLCFKNAPEFAGLFESIEGVKIKGRAFKVKFVSDETNLDVCHFLYINPSLHSNIDDITGQSQKGKFLTISSQPDFAHSDGMIGFALVDNRVKVEINLESTREAGFNVSARLLEVSRVVNQ